MVLGIGGYAKTGKDSLFTLLKQYGSRNYIRFAMADALKIEIRPKIMSEFGFDILDCSTEQKDSVRHLLVELGAAKRKKNKNYWLDSVISQIASQRREHPDMVPVICDVRYLNEAAYFESYFKDYRSIIIRRDGFGAANQEEEENTSLLYDLPNAIHLNWRNLGDYAPEDVAEIIRFLEAQIYAD